MLKVCGLDLSKNKYETLAGTHAGFKHVEHAGTLLN